MMKPESKRTIAIEDLLRLKRAERPPVEFWSQFERELRAKQLSALMARRPWWQRLPSFGPFFVRHRILIGATAVLAVTVVSLRNPRLPAVSTASNAPIAAPLVAVDITLAASADVLPRVADATAMGAPQVATLAVTDAGTPNLVSSDAVNVSTAGVGHGVAATVPSPLANLGAAAEAENPSSATHFVATTLTTAVPVNSSSSRVVGAGFAARGTPARTTVEPLQQMISPSETRRARLLTAMVSMAALENPARTTERVANRIDEERLYEQVSRFGARGDRFNVKF